MSSLPVLLKNQRILLLGGGAVALHKATVLKENQVEFAAMAREFLDDFQSMGLEGKLHRRAVGPDDLRSFNVIIDATGDVAVKAMLLNEKKQRFLLLNIVDDPDNCDFYFASLLNLGRLKIAVSTDGASPAVGQAVRDRIKQVLPEDLATLVEDKAKDRARGIIDAGKAREDARTCLAQVDLVGCGPGNVELLTLQACRCIETADVVLYDHLITQEVLELVPERAERIYVGKQKQEHSLKQDEVNQLTLEQARRGIRVVRLKSGDPYVFGRGAEEAEFLANHGIRVRVIPGISSAVAAPSAAGIPLTARGYATNVSIVSAHLVGSRLNTDWLSLLHIPNHTTVVLMGLSFAGEIRELAIADEVPKGLPVAIVANATRPEQKVIITTLEDLYEKSLGVERPAVLVFGNVTKLSKVLPHAQ